MTITSDLIGFVNQGIWNVLWQYIEIKLNSIALSCSFNLSIYGFFSYITKWKLLNWLWLSMSLRHHHHHRLSYSEKFIAYIYRSGFCSWLWRYECLLYIQSVCENDNRRLLAQFKAFVEIWTFKIIFTKKLVICTLIPQVASG